MIDPAAFYETLRRHGLTFFTGVPDSLLKDLCALIAARVPAENHVINANEGSAIAMGAGYHLATGRIPVIYLQNSGTGNTINPLLSLADPAVYAIPMLLIIGWRGEPGVPDEPQHVTQGRVMPELLQSIGLEFDVIDAHTESYDDIVRRAVVRMTAEGRPHAFLVRKNAFARYTTAAPSTADLPLRRAEAIETVLGLLGPEDLVVSTTGMTSREVFARRELLGQSHDRDFLTVGSMGHASQIAFGLAEHQPSCQVVCLDGDGAVIMHMGSLAIIGSRQPSNFKHVVINNGAHDSVGGQPTAARSLDLSAVALACGYSRAAIARTKEELVGGMAWLLADPGPTMLEIRVQSSAHTDAGRPTTPPIANKIGFMKSLRQ